MGIHMLIFSFTTSIFSLSSGTHLLLILLSTNELMTLSPCALFFVGRFLTRSLILGGIDLPKGHPNEQNADFLNTHGFYDAKADVIRRRIIHLTLRVARDTPYAEQQQKNLSMYANSRRSQFFAPIAVERHLNTLDLMFRRHVRRIHVLTTSELNAFFMLLNTYYYMASEHQEAPKERCLELLHGLLPSVIEYVTRVGNWTPTQNFRLHTECVEGALYFQAFLCSNSVECQVCLFFLPLLSFSH